MGLLDSILGSVLNGGQSPQQAPAAQQGGLGGLLGALASNPQLLQVLMGLLMGGQTRSAQAGGGSSAGGPLGGLFEQFQQAGLGDVLGSWVGTGQNQAISAEQLGQVFGQDRLSELGAQLGMGGQDLASELTQILPHLVDQMTPQGQLPQPGEGAAGNEGLFGMLEAFGQRR
ncbi:YidB family protein [Pseudorhodoferax sp.]|uniref:YidB family protein n=1 Tax=Pseudorhodoferax sp. TaxID=1993553 RepID=UPI0039E68265